MRRWAAYFTARRRCGRSAAGTGMVVRPTPGIGSPRGPTKMGYFCLGMSITGEVAATAALKATEDFTRLVPSIIVVTGYIIALLFLSLTVRTVPVGIAYAIWAGAGTALIVLTGAILFRETPDLPAAIGISLIVAGVVVVNSLSKMVVH